MSIAMHYRYLATIFLIEAGIVYVFTTSSGWTLALVGASTLCVACMFYVRRLERQIARLRGDDHA